MSEAKVQQEIEASVVDLVSEVVVSDLGAAAVATQVIGFLDVEKIITLGLQRFYIEKKLPFHVLVIRRPIFLEEDTVL